ncbi:unnamed protein product, partial [Coccothraustes coccothraustes]
KKQKSKKTKPTTKTLNLPTHQKTPNPSNHPNNQTKKVVLFPSQVETTRKSNK